MVTARQQLERTEVRAPFDGIVSDRKVSAGDTAQIGKELLKVIDPASLRFEGLVSADSIGEVQAGQTVWFRIHGFDEREFAGMVTRVNPAANATTRQVEVLVSFRRREAAAERGGPVRRRPHRDSQRRELSPCPSASVVREGDNAFAWRVKGDKAAEGRADARRARPAQRRVRRSRPVSPKATRCCASRTPRCKDGQAVQHAATTRKPAVVAEK